MKSIDAATGRVTDPAFGEAYACKPESPMVAKDAVRLWP